MCGGQFPLFQSLFPRYLFPLSSSIVPAQRLFASFVGSRFYRCGRALVFQFALFGTICWLISVIFFFLNLIMITFLALRFFVISESSLCSRGGAACHPQDLRQNLFWASADAPSLWRRVAWASFFIWSRRGFFYSFRSVGSFFLHEMV